VPPSLSNQSADISFAFRPSHPGSIGPGDFPVNADSALRGNSAAGLGAGLGVGLFVIVLLACGVLLWFTRRRRSERKDSEDPTETNSADTWDEDINLASGENTLASEDMDGDSSFTDSEIIRGRFE
jgi:hypothetical protein